MIEASNSCVARESILGSIRKNLEISKGKAPLPEHPSLHRLASVGSELDLSTDLIDAFQLNALSVGASCHVGSVRSAGEYIQDLARNRSLRNAANSDSPLVRSVLGPINRLTFSADMTKGDLFEASLGITEAQWGIAETGTLVLDAGAERGRLASLIPPIHVCLIRAEQIVKALSEILSLISRDLSPAVTFITGPSRTSDIELTLCIGVHGPGELHILVIE